MIRILFIMYDSVKFTLVHRAHWQHQTTVTQRRLNIIFEDAILFALGNDAPQGAIDATSHTSDGDAQFMQMGGCSILDITSLVKHVADGLIQFRKCLQAACQFSQPRIGGLPFVVIGEESHYLTHGHQ